MKKNKFRFFLSLGMVFTITILMIFSWAIEVPAQDPSISDSVVRNIIRNRIEAGFVTGRVGVPQSRIYSQKDLRSFYLQQVFQPAWVRESGPSPLVAQLIEAIRNVDQDGLIPSDYHLEHISLLFTNLSQKVRDPSAITGQALADLEILCTDAFLILARHLVSGKVNPETIQAEWEVKRRENDLVSLLQHGLEIRQLEQVLHSLRPQHHGYAQLMKGLSLYQAFAANGGWDAIPEKLSIKKGDRSPHITKLRQRLVLTGDLVSSEPDPNDLFDDTLEEALKTFQRRNGLMPDGQVGPVTREALRVTVDQRIQTILVNLERWRWLPQDLGERYILVNVPQFELDVVEKNQKALQMAVVVGKPYRRTPVFTGIMTYLVLNPYWHVPPSIATKDLLPKFQKDPGSVLTQQFTVWQGLGGQTREIDPTTISWEILSESSLPYRFRQEPGPLNALGKVKFMFPNKFNVYLHDTPAKDLFLKTNRVFSSGCIRIEKPIELAEYLLRDNTQWNKDAIFTSLGKVKDQAVRIPKPIPVHLLYWTAWADDQGRMEFRSDIYKRDAALFVAITAPPSES